MEIKPPHYKKNEDAFIHALLSTNKTKAEEIIYELAKKTDIITIGDKLIAPALDRIGKDWENGVNSLAQVYLSSHICNAILDKILTSGEPSQKKQPNLAIASLGDFHTIGKRIITHALKSSGYSVDDLGHGLLIQETINKCLEKKTEILLLSSLTLPSALLIRHLTEAFRDMHFPVKVIVGGTPFYSDMELWKKVGADAMGYNASDAPGIVKRLAEEIR